MSLSWTHSRQFLLQFHWPTFVTWPQLIVKKPGIIGKQTECFQIILSLIKWKQHRARWSRDLDSGCISASPSAQEPGQVIAFQAPGLDHLKKGAIPSLVFVFFFKATFPGKYVYIFTSNNKAGKNKFSSLAHLPSCPLRQLRHLCWGHWNISFLKLIWG